MSIYPQLISGGLAQFPISTRLNQRTCLNGLADGSFVKSADPNGANIVWQLQYAELTDNEAAAIEQFFQDCEGSLNGFTFLDPAANLLAWSEDLTNPAWQAAPLLAVNGAVADPAGGAAAFQLTNSASADQSITQTLNAPGGYTYTFSVYAMAAAATSFTLGIGTATKSFTAAAGWNRFVFAAEADRSANSVAFSISCPPGAITVFGPQAEAQPGASAYQTGIGGGVYENARFVDDTLQRITTAPNRNKLAVKITYVNHL